MFNFNDQIPHEMSFIQQRILYSQKEQIISLTWFAIFVLYIALSYSTKADYKRFSNRLSTLWWGFQGWAQLHSVNCTNVAYRWMTFYNGAERDYVNEHDDVRNRYSRLPVRCYGWCITSRTLQQNWARYEIVAYNTYSNYSCGGQFRYNSLPDKILGSVEQCLN